MGRLEKAASIPGVMGWERWMSAIDGESEESGFGEALVSQLSREGTLCPSAVRIRRAGEVSALATIVIDVERTASARDLRDLDAVRRERREAYGALEKIWSRM